MALFSYIIVGAGAVALILFPFFPGGRSKRPWMRKAICIAGVFGFLWALAGLTFLLAPAMIPERAYVSANNLRLGFGGAAIGLIVFLLLCKEFRKIHK